MNGRNGRKQTPEKRLLELLAVRLDRLTDKEIDQKIRATEKILAERGASGRVDLRAGRTAKRHFFAVTWPTFMLEHPRPIGEESDVAAAKAALAESQERIPYEQARHDLGL